MAKILLIGCGDLGTAIALQLHQSQQEVIGVRLSAQSLPNAMQTIQADVTKLETLSLLANLGAEIPIYCISANAYTDDDYYAHYVLGLKNVLATQTNNAYLKHVFFVSSTSVYGQTAGRHPQDFLNEDTLAMPADFSGRRMLEAESLLTQLRCDTTVLRLSGIYGKGRLALVNKAKEPSRWPEKNAWTNRIHRDDAAGFIAFLVQKVLAQQPVENCYVVTDDMPALQYDVLTWLAHQQSVDTRGIQTPVIQDGKRLSNQRLRATGFELRYPHYQIGYSHVLEAL